MREGFMNVTDEYKYIYMKFYEAVCFLGELGLFDICFEVFCIWARNVI